MRILISNDDGINAPGFAVLERIAMSLSDDIWVIAPETEQSGAGHSLTLHRPLRVRHIDERRMAVDGTPTDSVLLALNNLIPGARPELMLSGVNRGSNIADDVTYSGTTARPEPFRVWRNSVPFLPSRRNRAFMRRAWKSPQFEQEDISR